MNQFSILFKCQVVWIHFREKKNGRKIKRSIYWTKNAPEIWKIYA